MKALRLFATSLSIAVFAACCGLWLLLGASGTGWQMLAVPTGSMRPGMPNGSLAVVHRVSVPSLKVGDVITYINPLNVRQTITHRIVKTYRVSNNVPGFITQGDANTVPDVPIAAGSVLGKVVWHAPHLGRALAWMKSWAGIAVLVYIPALLIMIQELRRLNDYYRLSLPYRLISRRQVKRALTPGDFAKFAAAPLVALATAVSAVAWQPLVAAQAASNPVVLAQNHLSRTVGAPPTCQVHNNTNISVNTNSTQTATSGSVSNNGSTNGGNTTSGNASNTNSTSINVAVNNGSC